MDSENELISPRKWTEFAHLRFTNKDPKKPTVSKANSSSIIRGAGAEHAEEIARYQAADEIRFSDFPNRFVLKPADLSARRGVMLLTRIGEDRFHDDMKDRDLTSTEIVAEQSRWLDEYRRQRKRKTHLIAEEYVRGQNPGSIPFDFKFYTFYGKVGFIIQINRNVKPNQMAFFLDEYRSFHYETKMILPWKTINPGIPHLPDCYQEMIEIARRISLDLKTPFISVDMYGSVKGPLVGELTVIPGGPYYGSLFGFRESFDLELGQMWIDAASQLGEDIPKVPRGTFDKVRRSSIPMTLAALTA